MNLTPEQRTIGKDNFAAAIGSKKVRGDFLEKGVRKGIASGNGLGSYYYGYDNSINDRLRVGVLGTGDEGSVLIGAINPDFVDVAAIADVRPYNVHRAFHGDYYSDTALAVRPGLMAKYGWTTEDQAKEHVKVYADWRELIKDAEKLNLEAVIIALPLHLHAPAAIAAMQAGLHVLTEKLMAHSVHECKEMARVAETAKARDGAPLHLATGHQRHYNILYDNAYKLIQAGLLGDLHYIRAQWHRGNLPGGDSWRQPMPHDVKPDDSLSGKLAGELAAWQRKLKDPKEKANWGLWRKRVAQKEMQIADAQIADLVEKYGYQKIEVTDGGKQLYRGPAIEELIRWRLWNRTGGGLMAELGSHQLDAASIFISAMHGGKKQHPLCVMAAANRPLFPPDRDVEDHVYCLFEFPAPGYDPKDPLDSRKKITVAYASINGNGFGGYGETVFGTAGTLLVEQEKEAMLFRGSAVDEKIRVVDKKNKAGKVVGAALAADSNGDAAADAALGGYAFSGDISRGYTEEIEHWAWCIRNPAPENKPHCHPRVALADAVIALTTNLAAREGRRIEFRPEWFDPASDETPDAKG
ncbi:MAG: Gfo/Idh/MocA family oxidoreductase [Pirellulales bacterium]|nr:Gfo/Idh/MocA family oxidoreductase [Pirellulales bacterium]